MVQKSTGRGGVLLCCARPRCNYREKAE
jgi:hypothetical protein